MCLFGVWERVEGGGDLEEGQWCFGGLVHGGCVGCVCVERGVVAILCPPFLLHVSAVAGKTTCNGSCILLKRI